MKSINPDNWVDTLQWSHLPLIHFTNYAICNTTNQIWANINCIDVFDSACNVAS